MAPIEQLKPASGWRRGRLAATVIGVACLAGLSLVWLAVASQRGVAGATARHPMFVRCGLILLGSLAALAVMGAFLLRAGRAGVASEGSDSSRRAGVARDERGAAMVEFALMLPIAVGVVLTMIQAMLMMVGIQIVNYAAFAAARAAIDWIPQNLAADVASNYVAEPVDVLAEQGVSKKLDRIKQAAAIACLPISGRSAGGSDPSNGKVTAGIEAFLRDAASDTGQPGGTPNWNKLVSTQLAYSWQHTAVGVAPPSVPKPPGGPPWTFPPRDDITVSVTHDFSLSVPFVWQFFGGKVQTADGYVSPVTAVCTLNNEGVSPEIVEDRLGP